MVRGARKVSLALVVLLVMGSSMALAAAPAGATITTGPVLQSPANTVHVTSNPTFTWGPVTGATIWRIQIAKDSGFGQVEFDTTTYQRTFTPWERLSLGTHYWRVFAGDANGWGPPSDGPPSFTVDKPNAPANPAPAGHPVHLNYPSQLPHLTWNPVPGAIHYQIDVSTSSTFGSFTPYTIDGPALVLNFPQPFGVEFFWRVSAQFTNGDFTAPTDPNSYMIDWPAQPTVVKPVDAFYPTPGASQTDQELVWTPIPGAAYYEVQINRAVDGVNVFDEYTYANRIQPLTTLDNGNYQWRVRGFDHGQHGGTWSVGTQSQLSQFTRNWLAKPSLVTPANNGDAVDGFAYTWNPVEHATYYELQVGTDPGFTQGTYNTCNTTEITVTWYGHGPNETGACFGLGYGTTYYWRVRGIDEPRHVLGQYSDIYNFIRRTGTADSGSLNDPPAINRKDAFTLTGPANGATNLVNPVLTWTRDLTSIVGAHVRVINKDGATVYDEITYNDKFAPYTPLDPLLGPYKWSVTPVSTDGRQGLQPNQVSWRSFNVATQAPSGSITLSSSPASSASMPVWKWNPVTNATEYRIYTTVQGSGVEFLLGSVTGTAYAYPNLLTPFYTPNVYQVRVQAVNGGALLASSSYQTFTLLTQQEDAVTYHGYGGKPACNQTDALANKCNFTSTPVLSWDPVPAATGYQVYLSYDEQFTNLVYDYFIVPTNSFVVQQELADNSAGSAYYWHVRPCYGGICSLDPQGRTPKYRAFRKVSTPIANADMKPVGVPTPGGTPPSINVPENLANVANTNATFRWPNYLCDAVAPKTGCVNPRIEAKYYQLQVSADPAFPQPLVDDIFVDQPFYTPMLRTYPFDTTLYWRVRAYDIGNNALQWSQPNWFQRKGIAPTLDGPAAWDGNEAHGITGIPSFTWLNTDNGLPNFARLYRFELYKNADTDPNMSPQNLLIAVETPNIELTPYSALPPGKYKWRVQKIDGTNNHGPWTPGRVFNLLGAAPSLANPINGQNFTTDDIIFSWQAPTNTLAAVAKYRLQTSTNPEFTGLVEDVTTPMLTWASTKKYPFSLTPYYWRVLAYDSQNQLLGSSDDTGGGTHTPRTFFQLRGRPTAVSSSSAVAFAGGFTVHWTEPSSSGEGPIVGYRITVTPGQGNNASTVRDVGPQTLETTFRGYLNGNSYSVNVVAVNSLNALSPNKIITASPNGCANTPFADVPTTNTFCQDIAWLYGAKVTTGSVQADGSILFNPNGDVQRYVMAAFIYRQEGSPPVSATPHFADVTKAQFPSADFYDAMQWMFESGLSTGSANPQGGLPLYKPNDSVSRQAMGAFLHRYSNNVPPLLPGQPQKFADVPPGAPFYNDIQWMGQTGISNGSPNPNSGLPLYSPAAPVSRQAMAAFLHRFSDL